MLNNLKKNISLSILIIFIINAFLINFSYAENNWETSLCWNKTWEDRYNCQVKNYCEQYKPEEIIHKSEPYFEKSKAWEQGLLKNAKERYRKNQNELYACWVIKLQKNSYKIILKKLAKIDKTWTLMSKINEKILLKLKKLNIIEKEKKCSWLSNKEDWNSLQFKQKLLYESSYEYCKYNFYLDFLNNHFENIQNANKEYFSQNQSQQNSYKISQLAKIQSKLKQDIINEENHSAKVFSMAFQTYIDYENNYPVHILLELIKEDFIVLREKLYEVISPIDQVVYKINNAMSIH